VAERELGFGAHVQHGDHAAHQASNQFLSRDGFERVPPEEEVLHHLLNLRDVGKAR